MYWLLCLVTHKTHFPPKRSFIKYCAASFSFAIFCRVFSSSRFPLSSAAILAVSFSSACFAVTALETGRSTFSKRSTARVSTPKSLIMNLGFASTSISSMCFTLYADEISFMASTSSSSKASQFSASSSSVRSWSNVFRSIRFPPATSSSSPDNVNLDGKTISNPLGAIPLGSIGRTIPQCLGLKPGERKMQSILPSPLSMSPIRSIPKRLVHACR
mmetsp:Transcript_28108/g.43297  ORF Transcript_28108/g.43297 Transcript_28108/m.43297 type:complete len:216 (+) Transcript_28108:147-794(+)